MLREAPISELLGSGMAYSAGFGSAVLLAFFSRTGARQAGRGASLDSRTQDVVSAWKVVVETAHDDCDITSFCIACGLDDICMSWLVAVCLFRCRIAQIRTLFSVICFFLVVWVDSLLNSSLLLSLLIVPPSFCS